MKKIFAGLCVTALCLSSLTACTGFGGKTAETVNVQSVSMICDIGDIGLLDRFAGVVSSRGEQSYYADEEKTVKAFCVEEGELVKAGDVLFSYDVELAALDLEKAELELQQLNLNREALKQSKEKLETEKQKAAAEEQLSYSLEIRQLDAEIREADYNIALKEKNVAHLQESMASAEVRADEGGRVTKVNQTPGYDSSGNREASVTVVEEGAYRVKGYVNELNVSALAEGARVLIRSRVDDSTWTGCISLIDWENPKQSDDSSYYYGETDELTSTSEYPFYVELDDSEGLLLGQHVYIEPDLGQAEADGEALWLYSCYLFDIGEDRAFVWAEEDGKLARRELSLGGYDETLDSYEITDGLSAADYIAAPEEGLEEGMSCIEYDESIFDPGEDEFYDDGEDSGYVGGVVNATLAE